MRDDALAEGGWSGHGGCKLEPVPAMPLREYSDSMETVRVVLIMH